jgi:hypothetical protein
MPWVVGLGPVVLKGAVVEGATVEAVGRMVVLAVLVGDGRDWQPAATIASSAMSRMRGPRQCCPIGDLSGKATTCASCGSRRSASRADGLLDVARSASSGEALDSPGPPIGAARCGPIGLP